MGHPMMVGRPPQDYEMAFMQDSQGMSDQIPPVFPNQEFGFIIDPQFGNDLDFMFDEVTAPPNMGIPTHEPGLFNLQDSRDLMLARGGASQGVYSGGQEVAQRVYIPRELPFLISGVDSNIHKQLFCHFIRVMSQVLTISIGDDNPMNQVVIPLALRDRTIMDTLLCLAASHLLRLHQGQGGEELKTERSRLHEAVVSTQSYRIQALHSSSMIANSPVPSIPPNKVPDKEIIFATSLLLCLYEICEGTGDDEWRIHLDSARKVFTMALQAAEAASPEIDPQTSGQSLQRPATDIDPFLIEYFLYHDSLAAVTVQSLPLTKLKDSADLANHDPTMIGVQDGLSDFITRISILRAQAAASPHQPDGNVVSKAVLIWEDLANWKPNGCISTERKMIAEFYQWALFIWLFSIVYPDGKEDPKVQDAVQRIAGEMCNIKFGDSVMSCLLFPLFVIGSAAIRAEDREAVSVQFHRLKKWSSLGNIDLTFGVVEKIWADHDSGMPRSWDWVKQLETHGMSLLVT